MKTLTLAITASISFYVSCAADPLAYNTSQQAHIQSSPKPAADITPPVETSHAAERSDKGSSNGVDLKVGIVDVNKNGVICLRTQNHDLLPDQRILIIASPYDTPQSTVYARITKKLPTNCASADSDSGDSGDLIARTSYYEIRTGQADADKGDLMIGLAILDLSKPFRTSMGLINIDLNNDGKKEFFRACASTEGLHLTVWSGRPLAGKRIWHRYYYLHYGTEPDCNKKDYEGTDE